MSAIGFDILISSQTQPPLAELARAVAAALREVGADAAVVEDRLPAVREDRATIVVGPHDVLRHLSGADGGALTAGLTRSLLISTARPASTAWQADVAYGARAGALLHVSAAGVAALANLGLPARWFRLGYHATLDRSTAGGERPIDVAFVGATSPRRERIIASAAWVLARYDVELCLFDEGRLSDWAETQDTLACAKVALNVHPDDELCFEWVSALNALCNGAVVVSERSLGTSPLVAGRHFLSGSVRSLPFLVEVALGEPGRLETLRGEACAVIRDEHPLTRSVEALAEIAGELPGPAPRGRNFAVNRPANGLVPPSEPRPSEPERSQPSDELVQLVTHQNAVLKKLFFDLRLLRRQVAHVSHAIEDPETPMITVTRTPAVMGDRPEVSVIVSVHNYARYVREALESAICSQEVALEIIVVDDASIDGSAGVVRAVMNERPDVPITLLVHRVNTGVQRARNGAFAHARAPYAFVLDADNLVYPRGIAKLRDALAADPGAGFAYGLIERFDVDGATGLMGTHGWDPGMLAQQPYIDAMALVRLDAFNQVGGYVTDPLLELGWEDYDLWLSLAVAGFHGTHVREVIGRYRVHGVSSLTMTTLDTDDLMAKLRQRHAPFFETIPRGGDDPA